MKCKFIYYISLWLFANCVLAIIALNYRQLAERYPSCKFNNKNSSINFCEQIYELNIGKKRFENNLNTKVNCLTYNFV